MDTFDRSAIVKAFCDECVWVRSIRMHFAELFEGNDQRRSLLLETAGIFFHDINWVLIEYILLQQCKLTDPASSGNGKDNLTTNFILKLNWSSETKSLLSKHNETLLQFRAKIESARHKLIGHLDLRSRLGTVAIGSFGASDEDEFWGALQAFVDVAHDEAIGGPYEISATMQDGNVASLIHYLKDAVDYDDLADSEHDFLIKRIGKRRYEDA